MSRTHRSPGPRCLLRSAAVSRIMSRTHRSPGPRLEELMEELREKERFMSHGYQSFQYLLEALKSSGHSQCSTVWTKDTVAYRYRTCQINDSSAICEICFHQGDHKFHDFVMYRSESGGCCDCGDRDAWKEDGFCKIHHISNQKPGHLPAKLYEVTQKTVCWALEKLSISVHIIWARRLKDRKAAVENEIRVAGLYMEWVKKVCSVDVLRNLLSVLVTRKFLDGSQFEKNARGRKAPLEILLKTLGSMPEELTEGATTLFLQMLYNGWFKSQFTEELMKHYPLMVDDVAGKVIKHSQHEGVITECKALDSTLERVMVRLFNVAPTVMELIKNNNLLWKFTSVFDGVLKMSLNQRGTVSVEHEAIRHKVYLRPQRDLRLIVSHSPVAVYVLNERLDVFEEILKVVTYLQWMNPYTRNRPVDFENDNAWTLAIELERNTMAIVFQLIARCYSSAEGRETVKQALVEAGNRTLKSLHSYLSEETQKLTKSSMSLHIPLHRVLSAILSKLILLSWCDNKEGFLSSLKIDFTEEEVLSLLELPLRIAAWMVQIRANQWQHVSEEFFRLELIYRGSFWHDQSWDMDLLLLQFCAVAKEKMEHAIVLRMAECFDLRELVTTPSTGKKMFMVSPSYIQDFLRIILLVVCDRRNTGMNEEESLRYDVIQWLCVRDQTYSQLCWALSAIPVDHEKLSVILAEVADFRQPKVQEQGYFQLKPEWWTKFDPLFAQFYLNELEDAQERAGHVGKQQFYWRIGSPHKATPPYNRLTNLLHTQECHQLLWNVLNHVKILVNDNKTSTAGEALGVTALQMMEIALRDRLQYQPSSAALQPSGLHRNDILVNIKLSPYTYPGMFTWKLGSSSMYDLLQEFQSLTNAHRLADYAQYTLDLLHSSFPIYFGADFRASKLKKSPEYQASIVEDEWQRLKKERQAALLAKFSAQQKAFLEQRGDHEEEDNEHRYDDAGPTEGSHAGSEAGGNFERISGKAPAVVTLTETTFGIQECAFCRRKCDSSDSPAGWIALMQCYNMPRQVLKKERAQRVKILEEAESIAKGDDTKQLVTLIEPQNLDSGVCDFRGGSLDYYPTEHVACCGHQMHQACFESYVSNLGHQHHQGNSYEGKYIIDVVSRGEIWCPICRRLANVLLPVVEESCLQRILDGQAEGSTDENLSWRRFWDPQKKIVKAIDGFASQTVRVREKFCVMLEAKDVPSCQLLWEVFAGNIVHFEVETREKINDSGSSSSAPIRLRDAWGGEAGHLTALQELGKLAMLSNTSNADIVLEKKTEQLKRLWRELALLCWNEKKMDAPGSFDLNSAPVRQHLTEILEKLFPPDSSHSKREVDMKNVEMSEVGISRQASIGDCPRTDFITSPALEEKREEIPLHKSSTPHSQGGLGMEHLEQTLHKGLSKDLPPQPSSGEYQPSTIPEIHEYEYMHPKFMEGHLLEVDPFAILTCLLLSCFEGCLKLRQIIWMVEFAYIVAIIQTSIALTRLEAHLEAVNIKLVIQNACLPFLRRAALLVQLVPCEELDTKHYGSGRKLMDAAYLEQYLEQQEVWGSIAIDQVGENKQITVLEYLQQRFSTSELLNSPSWGILSLPECSDFYCSAADCVQPDRSKQGLHEILDEILDEVADFHQLKASIAEDEQQRLKKERPADTLARYSALQKGFIEQHEDHEDDDNEHRHDDAGPTEGSHAVMYDSDSPGCCDCTNGGAWKEDWPNMLHTSIMVNYFQLILESIKEVQKIISQGSLDDWNSEKKFLRINKSQCEYLASELEEIQTYLELQSHVSRHIKHGVTMKHLYHTVKKAEMLVMECCSEKWLLKAVALMDSKENFVEIVLELQWWKNMVHIAILEIQETRTSSLLLQLQDADKAYEDFLNQRLHILEKELLEDKQMLVTKLEQVTSGWLTDDTLELRNYLLHRLGRTGQSRDCATHSPFSWRPSQFKNGVHVNLDADALGYDNTATVVKVRWLMGQEFVVKLFTRGVQEKDAMVAKASEAIILSKIRHPHVVQLMCYWDNQNLKTCLLMEKMAGDISRLMAQQTTKETSSPLPFSPCKQSIHPFSLLEAMQIMLQVAKAMCFLHSKEVAHRDLKCRNILWKQEPFDNHLYVKLADFGEAKTNVRNSTTDQQQTWLVGTTGWRAPELSGEHMLTHKRYPLMVDVFSFGMTFFEVLTGQGPFQAELRMTVQTRIDRGERPDLPKTCPPFLAFLIHSCWDGNPKARPTFPQICRMLLHGQNLILGMTWYDEDVKSKLFSYTSLDGIKKELKVMPVADRLK